jgi:prepilin-type N-terminal cleavage/methylation domain-containing protein
MSLRAASPGFASLPERMGPARSRRGFTLVELIAVLAILTITVSFAAPALSNFFRGRSLNSEARRLLALTHQAQSRAISEGVPMDLWVDSAQRVCGLTAEPSYEPEDSRAVVIPFDGDIRVEVLTAQGQGVDLGALDVQMASPSTPLVMRVRTDLPNIRFMPDGTVTEDSPEVLQLTHLSGESLWLVLSGNRMTYEIRNASN